MTIISAFAFVWIGTWATAPQHWSPGRLQTFSNQSVRLIVHTSAGGGKARVRISNLYGDRPLHIGSARLARRTKDADIDPASDRRLTFAGNASVTIAPHSAASSDPVDFDVPPISDVAVSFFFPDVTLVTTTHALAVQTSYISNENGDATAEPKFPAGRTTTSWPFLTGIDVQAADNASTIVAFGSSTTDGDGSTKDANHRWPDALAERLQEKCPDRFGILNEGIIGNRLLTDDHSPHQTGGPFSAVYEDLGPVIGESGIARFQRDVLDQPNVKYAFFVLGINDILFPGSFVPAAEQVTAKSIIEGNRRLIARAHKSGIRVIMTTIPPFKDVFFRNPTILFYTPEKEQVREEVNSWMRRNRGEFDGLVDFDELLRDPADPQRLRSDYDSGDHIHANDAGYVVSGNAVPLSLVGCGQ